MALGAVKWVKMTSAKGCPCAGWLLLLPLAIAACAPTSGSGVEKPSVEHWGYELLGGDRLLSKAEILRPSGDHAVQVLCHRLQGHMQVRVWPPNWENGPLDGPPEARRLALGFDGKAPVRQIWSNDANGFTLAARDPGFENIVDKLQSHQTMTLVTEGANAKQMSEELPLDGARQAIDLVFADCKNPIM
jgi:hypothetical protein